MIEHPYGQMTPGKSCPFRIASEKLRPGRVTEILNELLRDQQFICHGKVKEKVNCAGSLILMVKSGLSNNPMRMAERLQLFDPRKLDKRVAVYESFAAMEAAMVEAAGEQCGIDKKIMIEPPLRTPLRQRRKS